MEYDKPAAGMAHSRSIALLRTVMGPHYDLGALWEKHTMYEFGTRDVAATTKTMVANLYVNHVPTMTGGVGASELARFYRNHFIPKCPKDTKLVPISRTIGADRLVDEMLFCFTQRHRDRLDAGRREADGKICRSAARRHRQFPRRQALPRAHILGSGEYWDQASVLTQIGLLDTKSLPAAGIETPKKLVDETLPSNTLMKRWEESAPKRATEAPRAPAEE